MSQLLRCVRALGLVVVSLALAACGGGDGKGRDVISTPDAVELAGPACEDCRAGFVSGVAAIGAPLALAQVRLLDAAGQSVNEGQTDAQGRYELRAEGRSGPLIVQVTGQAGGQPVLLHSVVRGPEIGRRFIQVTPLTELITARVLGGLPADAVLRGDVNEQRLSAVALADAERQIEAMVRALLDAVGVGEVDLRLSPLVANGLGLDRALELIQVSPNGTGHTLRAVWQDPDDAQVVAAGSGGSGGALPAPEGGQIESVRIVLDAAHAEIQQSLDRLAALYRNGLPGQADLEPWFSERFVHGGLDRGAFLQRVMLRSDPPRLGGFNLVGVRFDQLRILQVRTDQAVRVGVRIVPSEPHEPYQEVIWMVREDGRWRWQGDGQLARARVRHMQVLTSRPLAEADVRALTGAACFEVASETNCRVNGGLDGVPSDGFLDLGQTTAESGAEGLFGRMALFRSQAATAEARLQAYAAHSRLLAKPSAAMESFIVFELDARQSDARAVRAVVRGPGLPVAGIRLLRPATAAGVPEFDHWAHASAQDTDTATDDWAGVPWGWCAGSDATTCAVRWATVGQGSVYVFELQDAQGQVLGEIRAGLPVRPSMQRAAQPDASELARFSRWTLATSATGPLTLGGLLGASQPSGDVLLIDAPWQAPQNRGLRPTQLDAVWHRAGFAPYFGEDTHRERLPVGSGTTAGNWLLRVSAREGFRSTWLVLRATSSDAHGNRFVHALAPSNPQ